MALKGFDELVKKIRENSALSNEDILKELNGILPAEWVPKATFNELSEELKAAKKAKAETDTLLKDLQSKADLSDTYKTQIADLEAAQKAAAADFSAKLGRMKLDTAVEKALTGAKAKNPSQCARLLDIDKLKLSEDGSVIGLKEQVDSLLKDSAYLFDAVPHSDDPANGNQPTQKGPSFGGGRGTGNNVALDEVRAAFGLGAK